MKTREELIEAMEQTFVESVKPGCTNILDSSKIAEKMFDALLGELPMPDYRYIKEMHMNADGVITFLERRKESLGEQYYGQLKAVERKATPRP